jgi:mRNA interferase MazF
MQRYKPGSVVKVPFPYTNRPTTQYRPALVLAEIADHSGPPLLWVVMITSAAHRRWEGDIEIADSAGAGLPVASVVRPSKIATIESRQAIAIGMLELHVFDAVRSWVVRRLEPVV